MNYYNFETHYFPVLLGINHLKQNKDLSFLNRFDDTFTPNPFNRKEYLIMTKNIVSDYLKEKRGVKK